LSDELDGSKPILVDGIDQLVEIMNKRAAAAHTPVKERAGQIYCPSSGSEGMDFEATYCERCVFQNEDEEGLPGCPIALQAHAIADAADPDFPNQWRYDKDGRPSCIMFNVNTEAYVIKKEREWARYREVMDQEKA
jgi:hypothetical protein